MSSEPQNNWQQIDQLKQILQHLKEKFVGKDEIIDLMGICLAGRENLFLLGPPGTAKSAMVRELSTLINGKSFEYLLTRFTEPNEIFGPFDIRKLRDGDLVTNTEGMLPEAHLIFLDELLNANSAILNSLLMVLNERIFRRGRENRALPVVMTVGASNHLPEDEALQALFDRFLIRVRCDYVDPALLNDVLDAGWKLEQKALLNKPEISIDAILQIQTMIGQIDLMPIRESYINLIEMLRNAGIPISDRRAVKLQRLIAASALICKRTVAIPSDMWVMQYIWDTEEQQELIAGIVNTVVQKDNNHPDQHPRASVHAVPNADDIYKEVMLMAEKWEDASIPLTERTIIKDRLRFLNGRCEWISNHTQRSYVQDPIDALWKKIIQFG
ncbi:AAA domain-containing protein [Pseudoflavitalea sp. G-6-1-2]|uniref:AAA family ATPase n=1 Tax=Pseudoflavitalea sp. G-6-1-2 TaxID=2728841 RepID=UPI00146EED95|nr:AAA family ATPase [Pseudoflavitalea sp. G-6-1-2]NML20091.1 AAA domain-containing protein [Pseudoflavitalea sp. G-6-1-2]